MPIPTVPDDKRDHTGDGNPDFLTASISRVPQEPFMPVIPYRVERVISGRDDPETDQSPVK